MSVRGAMVGVVHRCVGGAVMFVRCAAGCCALVCWWRSGESEVCSSVSALVCWRRSDECEMCSSVLCIGVLAAQ